MPKNSVHPLASTRIGFIGGGNMAQAIIGGLIDDGVNADLIFVVEPNPTNQQILKQQLVNIVSNISDIAQQSDVIVLAVKPQVISQISSELEPYIQSQIIVSIAAGIPLSAFYQMLNGYPYIVRTMPNTPALIKQGITGAFASEAVSPAQKEVVTSILKAIGSIVWVEKETDLDTVTAISGSGPAYYFYLMENMIEAGVQLGLSEETSRILALQTAKGASLLAAQSDLSPLQLRLNVTSPNGTTQAAIESLTSDQTNISIHKAIHKAYTRSQELADEMFNNSNKKPF